MLLALGKLAKFTLRLLFIVVLGVLLGLGIYWGAAYGVATVNRQVFQPIQNHAVRLDDLESRYAQDYGRMNERTQALQERIDALESRSDATREALDALQTRLTTSETLLGDMRATLDAAQEGLSALETRQDAFEPTITELETTFTTLETTLTTLETALGTLETAMGTLAETVEQTIDDVETLSIFVKDEAPLISVRTDVQLLKAMELLTRARLQLALDNLGMATTEVQEARDLLLALAETLPPDQQEEIAAIVQRLDLGLANLPDAPRLAIEDFEIAWQLLIRGLPSPQLTATETMTPTETQAP